MKTKIKTKKEEIKLKLNSKNGFPKPKEVKCFNAIMLFLLNL
jgi:hypothetical protein